ncbi:MAG: Negative regulator of beta-lactamase expression [uncultured Rubrobacteraceae bacterium]|uniref:Negative regulator of beta-lactamase expression n=1 Tax=uncultured Rubrobacteraceae bacterium TaxID=349277 RepID=A0A6J4R829_9ACTN|nr:MAG: Negative regulator of beta-lactamase expression [uncultured Rubrobacteraceae bacterium]
MSSTGSTEGSRSSMDRRRFLKLSGAGVTGAFLLAAVGAGDVLAEPASELEREFEEAAAKYAVPVEVLLAMGYVNTRWEMPPPEASAYERGDLHGWGSYGIMALVQNPSSDTLGEASLLTGIPEARLKTDRKANIMGGAALLAESQGKKPSSLGGWLGAVNGRGGNGKMYRAVAGIGGGELYAEQISETLLKGAVERTKGGERVSLKARSLQTRMTSQGRVL